MFPTRVVHVSGSRVTTLAEVVGLSSQYFQEGAQETTLQTLALADLDGDGDGDHDAVIATRRGEDGNVQRYDVRLSIWPSRTKQLTFTDIPDVGEGAMVLARGQPRGPGQPLVLWSTRPWEWQRMYRCVEPTGTLDLCPAAAEAKRIDRAEEIAGWFSDNRSGSTGVDRGQRRPCACHARAMPPRRGALRVGRPQQPDAA